MAAGVVMTGKQPSTDLLFCRPAVSDEDIREVEATLRSGWLTTGPRVKEFEDRFAEYAGARHAVALNSCTAALHLSLLACGVGAGDEVITTPLTFCATANAIVHTGATPIFVDVNRATGNVEPADVAAAITRRTRALLPVHYAGRPVDMDGFRDLADASRVRLIEDAAHCIEGRVGTCKVGANADLTCFSFYATKNLTTGEGGMLTTDSDEWAGFARVASLHGLSQGAWARYSNTGPLAYEVEIPGFKYNMMDIQAALGIHQLDRLEDALQRREAICRSYDEAFADLPLSRPAAVPSGAVHARHLYTVLVDADASGITRDGLRRDLQRRGIGTGVHFHALHLHRYYARRFELVRGQFPNAEFISDRTVSLPLSLSMSDADVARVIDAVRAAIPGRLQAGHAA